MLSKKRKILPRVFKHYARDVHTHTYTLYRLIGVKDNMPVNYWKLSNNMRPISVFQTSWQFFFPLDAFPFHPPIESTYIFQIITLHKINICSIPHPNTRFLIIFTLFIWLFCLIAMHVQQVARGPSNSFGQSKTVTCRRRFPHSRVPAQPWGWTWSCRSPRDRWATLKHTMAASGYR